MVETLSLQRRALIEQGIAKEGEGIGVGERVEDREEDAALNEETRRLLSGPLFP